MQRIFVWLLVMISIAGCSSLFQPGSGVYRGIYVTGFEMAGFKACGYDEIWWVEFDLAEGSPGVGEQAEKLEHGWDGGVYVEWRGEPSQKGSYGHMGSYVREIKVTEVLTVTDQAFADCE